MKISDSVAYIGVNDYDADLFEGQYKVEHGMVQLVRRKRR